MHLSAATTLNHRLRNQLAQTGGAIDLASIMVGVLVIGIVGSVIAATVMAVIPWSQNEAAKQNLQSVATAEAASRVLDGRPMAYDSHPDSEYRILETQGLERPSQRLIIDTAPNGAWFAVQESATGSVYLRTSASPDAVEAEEAISLLAAGGATTFSQPGLSVPATVVPAGISGAAVQSALAAVLDGTVYDFGSEVKLGHGAAPELPGEEDSNMWTVPDPALRQAIRDQLGLAADTELTFDHAARLSPWLVTEEPIASLTGLERATGLRELAVWWTPALSDLSPVAALTDLTTLVVDSSGVADISIVAGLSQLQRLAVNNTPVFDLSPLAGHPSLITLEAGDTQVTDISALYSIPTLRTVQLSNTRVTAADVEAFRLARPEVTVHWFAAG